MKRIIYFLLLIAMVGTGCKKSFLDINQNPNAPTPNSITPSLILPRALHATGARMAVSYDFLQRWMGYWARSGTYGPSTEEESYNITNTFEQTQWSVWYDILNDFDIMEDKAAALGQSQYQAIAKVMKAVGFMHLVDMYNNVPYSQAFDLTNYIQPVYDNGQDIYNDLFVQLDNALVLINDATTDDPGLATTDIMFHGDMTMWEKFINTWRLKMSLRQSEVPGFDFATQMSKITGVGFLASGETAAVNPGYLQDDGKQNPFYDTFEANYLGDGIDDYNRANIYLLGLLQNNNDPRVTRIFDPVQASCPTCNPPVTAGTYYGYIYGEVNTDPDQPKAANSSGVGGPGLAVSPTQDQWILTSVESLFLQAEAIQRGWLPGDPEAAYRAAVTESFTWLGLTVADAMEYLDNEAIADWDAAGDKIELIITQKYIAMAGINAFESWSDYRRTGFPDVPLSASPARTEDQIPRRLRYPLTEYNYNAPNVEAQNNPSPFDTGVFWDL